MRQSSSLGEGDDGNMGGMKTAQGIDIRRHEISGAMDLMRRMDPF